jgi:hypothetical protein
VAPPWFGPPEDVIGEAAGAPFVLARTNALALAVWGITAFPTGITFSLAIVRRALDDGDFDPDMDTYTALHRYWRARRRDPDQPLPDDLLRFGVEFEDGRKATNLGWHWDDLPEGQEPPGPILQQRGGGGGGRSYRHGWWLWPLPPGDRLAFVTEWPAQGIELSRHEIDAEPLRRAAGRARPIWGSSGTEPD